MSEFTNNGHEYPSLYTDENYLHKFSTLTDDRLMELHDQYENFIQQDVFKPHLERAERIMEHIKFELLYRMDYFK